MVTETEAAFVDKEGTPQIGIARNAVSDLGGTAGATYTSVEQAQINNNRVDLNTIKSILRYHNLMKT